MLEMVTNCVTRIPQDKLDGVLHSMRDVISLLDDARPSLYLGASTFEKDIESYLPSEPPTPRAVWRII